MADTKVEESTIMMGAGSTIAKPLAVLKAERVSLAEVMAAYGGRPHDPTNK